MAQDLTSGLANDDWRSEIPAELAGEACFTDIPDKATLYKNYVNAQKMIGGSIRVPDENSTPEQIAEFRKKMGVPESPDEYTLGEDTEWAEGTEALRQKAHELGLTVEQVRGITEAYTNLAEERAGRSELKGQDTINALREEWGAEADTNLGLAQQIVKTYGDAHLVTALNETGAGNSVEVIKFLSAIGRTMASEGLVAAQSLGVQTREALLNEADGLMASPAFNDPQHADHSRVAQRVSEIYEQAYR